MQVPPMAGPAHVAKQVLRDRKPVLRTLVPQEVEQGAETPEHRRALRSLALKSSLFVPLLAGDSCVGVMGFGSGSEPFAQRDLPLALEIGRRCALFIESARLRGSEKRATQARDEVLAVVAQDLRSPLGSFMVQLSASPAPPRASRTPKLETGRHARTGGDEDGPHPR